MFFLVYFAKFNLLFLIEKKAVVPVLLTLFWPRINSTAMFYSQITGCIVGILSWILATILLYGNLDISQSGIILSI